MVPAGALGFGSYWFILIISVILPCSTCLGIHFFFNFLKASVVNWGPCKGKDDIKERGERGRGLYLLSDQLRVGFSLPILNSNTHHQKGKIKNKKISV